MAKADCPECERQYPDIGNTGGATNMDSKAEIKSEIKVDKKYEDWAVEPNLDKNCVQVLEKRYLLRDLDGKLIETPRDMFIRVAFDIAEAENAYGKKDKDSKKRSEHYAKVFYEMMASLKFLPNSPTLMNAGTPIQMLSACFVLPVEDSIDSICATATDSIKISKAGGGVGFNFSKLRPKGSPVGSTSGVASGPISFMTWYNAGTKTIAQGGRRRGANIGLLRVDHPDIMDFIRCKTNLSELTGFNISVVITDQFMQAVNNDKDFDLINPHTKQVYKTMKARDIWNAICENAHSTGEPGLFFIDAVNKKNPTVDICQIESCNPCFAGETQIATRKGLRLIKDLDGLECELWDGSSWVESKVSKTGTKPVVRITLSNGVKIRVTNNHVLKTKDSEITAVESLHKELVRSEPKYDNISENMHSDNAISPLTVVNVQPDGECDVYDFSMEKTHWASVSGILAHNCGELPLEPYGSCNLGSINLSKFVNINKKEIDYAALGQCVKDAVRFLDDVIDRNKLPIKKIEKETLSKRKIGLGVMGWADVLFMLRISYTDQRALSLASEVMSFIDRTAKEQSIALAEERGIFPDWDRSTYAHGENPIKIRNASYTTIAPTGTLSMIANCSSSIEPAYALGFTKNVLEGANLRYFNDYFIQAMKETGVWNEEMEKKVVANHGSCCNVDGIPLDMQRVFVTAHDIHFESHVRMQAAFQEYVTNSISKTINMIESATVDEVKQAYMLAWELGCKGITVYRNNSREGQVLDTGVPKQPAIDVAKHTPADVLPARRLRIRTSMGHVFVTISYDLTGPREVFTTIGKAGSEINAMAEGLSRVISKSLTGGIPPEELAHQLIDIKSEPVFDKGEWINSLPDAVGQALKKFMVWHKKNRNVVMDFLKITEMEKSDSETSPVEDGSKKTGSFCPDCGAPLIFVEKCRGGKCPVPNCGYSKC
jgi:ribonucleoside-diphosphate reductase alpha chain